MVADDRRMVQVSAEQRQQAISGAAVTLLDTMNGDEPEKEHACADQALLEVLYAHGEFELVRAYKEAQKRADWWNDSPTIITP